MMKMKSQPLELATMALSMFHLTGMNMVVLNRNGTIHLMHIRDQLPEFMADVQQDDFHLLSAEAQQSTEQCLKYTNAWGISYLARAFRINEDDLFILVCGPFLMQVPDSNRFVRIDQQKRIELEAFYRGLKLVSNPRMQSFADLLDTASTLRQADIRVLIPPSNVHESSHKNVEHYLEQPDEDYIDLIELRYEVEMEIMRAVERGDSGSMKQLLLKISNLFDFSERFPNHPVRAVKNSLVILNTILRLAARNGNVQPYYLHQISEKFAKQIERSETIDSLNQLVAVMCDEYCTLVRHQALSGYSPLVRKAAEYIAVHYSKPFNLTQLSDALHVNSAHLSRQFKKETGMTLTDFHQKRRIEEAKILLKNSESTIRWIADYVGFDDAGYFTRTFRKLEGMTPSQYRNSGGT
jgi:two-component system, response regulator YesN